MAPRIVAGSVPVPDHPLSETFTASSVITPNGAPPNVDPVAQALMCCQHARDCIWAARSAREVGHADLALAWLKSAEFFRLAAAVWHQRVLAGWRAAP